MDRKQLTNKLHALKTQLGMTDDHYRSFLSSFGVSSSKELDDRTLHRAVAVLAKQLLPTSPQPEPNTEPAPPTEQQVWRKRVFGSVGGYLKLLGYTATNNVDYIKQIAINSTGGQYTDFNKIPTQQLVTIYYTFRNKQNTFSAASREAERLATQKLLSEMNYSQN